MGKKEKLFYAVAKGYRIGIFSDWLDAGPSVQGYKGNLFRGYDSLEKAKEYMKNAGYNNPPLFIDGARPTDEILQHNNSAQNSNPQLGNNNMETGVPASFSDGIDITEDDNEVYFNAVSVLYHEQHSDALHQFTEVVSPITSCDNENDDEMYGRENYIETTSISTLTDNVDQIVSDQTYAKQYCNDSNASDQTCTKQYLGGLNSLVSENECSIIETVSNLNDDGLNKSNACVNENKFDGEISECQENQYDKNVTKEVEVFDFNDIKTFIREHINDVISRDLELLKIQTKNEIKVASNHNMQKIIDENEELKKQLNSLRQENQKLSSSFGDLRKNFNILKCKYNDILDTNESLHKKLDSVMEQQKDIAIIGNSLCSVLVSCTTTKEHKESSLSVVPCETKEDNTTVISDGQATNPLTEKSNIPSACQPTSCDPLPPPDSAGSEDLVIPTPQTSKSIIKDGSDHKNNVSQTTFEFAYNKKTSNKFNSLMTLHDNDNYDNENDNSISHESEQCNVTYSEMKPAEQNENSKIPVHFSKAKKKHVKRKKFCPIIPRFEKRRSAQSNTGNNIKERFGDGNESYQSESYQYSAVDSSLYQNAHLRRNSDISDGNGYHYARPQNSQSTLIHDKRRKNAYHDITIEQKQYIQLINYYWFNCQRMLQIYNQNYGCYKPTH